MAKTNEIKEIKEESEIVDGIDGAEKPVEGFSHLTDADLDPDFEPPQEAKETEAEEVAETTAVENAEEGEPEVKETEVSSDEWNINGTTYSEGDLTTRMTKDYENLSSFSGKQAEQIGGYKHRIDELESKLAVDANINLPANPDANSQDANAKRYDIYTEEGILDMVNDRANAIAEAREADHVQTAKAKSFDVNADKARTEFTELHPEYKDEKAIVELIQYGTSKGLALGDASNAETMRTYLETVYAQKTGNYGFFTNKASDLSDKKITQDETIKRVKASTKVDKGLSSVNSSETDGVDYDTLSDVEWARLPEAKRQELLGI